MILGLAVLADAAQLAFIIGAFVAGLAIGRSDHHGRIAGDLNSVGGIFIPVFFVLIGVNADLGAMLRPSVLLDAAILLVVAIAGKIISCYGAAGTTADRLLVGFGMIPRGEVGLIFASIGLAQGVLDEEFYGALLLVVLLTTVVTPPLLRWRIDSTGRADVATLDESTTPEPEDGWVALRAGEIVLMGSPPSSSIAAVALHAAALAHSGRPSEMLLQWFGERRTLPVSWTPRRHHRAPRRAASRQPARRASARRDGRAGAGRARPSPMPLPGGGPTRASSIRDGSCGSRRSPSSRNCSPTPATAAGGRSGRRSPPSPPW